MAYTHEGLSGPGEPGDPWERGQSSRLCGVVVFVMVLLVSNFLQTPRTGTVLKVRNVNLKTPLIIVSLSKSLREMVTSWCLWRREGREKKMH